jgi:hypothetical protein
VRRVLAVEAEDFKGALADALGRAQHGQDVHECQGRLFPAGTSQHHQDGDSGPPVFQVVRNLQGRSRDTERKGSGKDDGSPDAHNSSTATNEAGP